MGIERHRSRLLAISTGTIFTAVAFIGFGNQAEDGMTTIRVEANPIMTDNGKNFIKVTDSRQREINPGELRVGSEITTIPCFPIEEIPGVPMAISQRNQGSTEDLTQVFKLGSINKNNTISTSELPDSDEKELVSCLEFGEIISIRPESDGTTGVYYQTNGEEKRVAYEP